MATTDREETALASDLLDALGPEGIDAPAASPRGGRLRWLPWAGLIAVLATASVMAYATLETPFGAPSQRGVLTHTVRQGDLVVSVTEDGNLESASNVDIKCEVAGGSTILWIVEDGRHVEAGEVLARLDSSQLEDQISQQKITYEKAHSTYVQAEKDYNVALISVKEYEQGTFVQQLQDLEAQITIAMENLRSAQNSLQHNERMFRKGYVSPLQLEAQQFAVKRAELDLASARKAKEVLEEFTKAKTLEDLNAQVETAKARMNSEKASFELEEARLKRLEAQLAKCVIKAPKAGMVVYANDTGGGRFGSQQPQIEEGAMVREQQTIFRLPDLSQMQVKVTVHESKVDQLRVGMRARVRILDQEFQGSVASVANQPEPTSWHSANVKEYATIVKIEGEHANLKPGMTAEAEILVAHLKGVVPLPVATVVEQRGRFFCWVKQGEQIEKRPLVLGMSNDKFVEVQDGVAVGEQVVLNPRAVLAEAREGQPETDEVDVEAKFGAASQAEMARPAERRGGAGSAEGRSSPGAPDGSTRPGPPSKAPAGEAAPGRPPDGPGAAPGGGRRNLMEMDQDGDGKISRDEAPERMREFFDRIDANGDGLIDAGEAEAMRSRAGAGPPGGGPPGPGAPSAGP